MSVIATVNVSGIAALRYVLVDTTTFNFTNGVDQQRLVLTLQQDSTGSRTVVSGNCPGIMQPVAAANSDTTMVLVYDSVTNSWNGVPQQSVPGSLILNTTTTSTTIAWARGSWLISGASTVTMTLTNPVAGAPGTGNDGEVMLFMTQAAQPIKITMGTTQTLNGTSTSLLGAGANGNAITLLAYGGKVYVQSCTGALTLS
jgi:hypothetical protein